MPDAPPGRTGRTWPQRLTIAALVVASVVSFIAAGALAAGQWVVSNRNLVDLGEQAPAAPPATAAPVIVPGGPVPTDPTGSTPSEPTEPTFPQAEPGAKNFLITGADNNACVDPDSPYAPAFGDRTDFGERSDTIMVWRVNPGTGQVAVLSFPRDLYVQVSNGGKGRINSAYRRDDPDRLRDTIYLNFGIPIDHYVQVDFCAFKRLVDGVGGVAVPFVYPARDRNTGLDVPVSGGECYTFDGDHALAYVRSRKYEYEDPPGSGNWRQDGTSDLGRISRQQDFLRRTVAKVLASGFDPATVSALIETNQRYLTIDDELTPSKQLEFAGVLRGLQPEEIASYQIEADPKTIQGNAVLVPDLDGANMQAILSVFRGEATLAEAPDQQLEADATDATRPGQPTTTTTPAGDDAPVAVPTETLPSVVAEENTLGISPPRDIRC